METVVKVGDIHLDKSQITFTKKDGNVEIVINHAIGMNLHNEKYIMRIDDLENVIKTLSA